MEEFVVTFKVVRGGIFHMDAPSAASFVLDADQSPQTPIMS